MMRQPPRHIFLLFLLRQEGSGSGSIAAGEYPLGPAAEPRRNAPALREEDEVVHPPLVKDGSIPVRATPRGLRRSSSPLKVRREKALVFCG